MSDNFISLFGSSSMGKKCWELYRDDQMRCPGCPIKNGIIVGKTDNYESKNFLGDRVFDISHTGIMYKGMKAMLEIFHDVTERKRVEQELIKAKEKAEESEKLKSAFLANMSHEIRTPMNGILGFAELLREPRLTGEEQQEYIDIIQKSGERMLTIINDIITISKVEAGQMKVLLSETNLNDLSEYIFKFFKPEAEQKGLVFSYSSQLPDKGSFILTDKEKVLAILINLVKNAFKFTFKGDSVKFGYEVKDSEYKFFVTDTGIGIPPEQIDIIFERFRQVNDSLNRKFEGAGLGLSISKAYVEMLGGKIWVESQYKAGSTFYFTIPKRGAEKDKHAGNTGLGLKNKISKLKILIVDDDEISLVLLSKLMKDYGREILKANNGAKAVEICRDNPDIELIMMDIQMPEKDGYRATKQIREFNKDVIIIAQTAFALSGDDLKAREAGCSDYIAKPIKRESLEELICKWFK